MTPSKQSIVDIPDFMNKPQETRVTIAESVLQESMRHECCKGFIAGLMGGFLTGSFVTSIIWAIAMTLGII